MFEERSPGAARAVETLSDKRIMNNIRIYKRDGGGIIGEKPVSPFLRYLPQYAANFSVNLTMFVSALSISFPTLLMSPSKLTVNRTSTSPPHDFLHLKMFDDIALDEMNCSVTWLLMIISVVASCLIGACLIDRTGRKIIMFYSSCLLFASWILYFFAQNIAMIYIASVLSGLGVGLGEVGVAVYQGEMLEPLIRGSAVSLSVVFYSVGLSIPHLLQNGIPLWRWLSLVSSMVAVLVGVVCLIVPESPVWLLSNGEVTAGEKSLRWLRGGAKQTEIEEEMQAIITNHHASTSFADKLQPPNKSIVKRVTGVKDRLQLMKRRDVGKPVIICCVVSALGYVTGPSLQTFIPFPHPEFEYTTHLPYSTLFPFSTALAEICGNILTFLIVGLTGKRILLVSGLLLSGVGALLVGLSLSIHWPVLTTYVFLHLMRFCYGYGVQPMVWMLQTELYPFRCRGECVAVVASLNQILCLAVGVVMSSLPFNSIVTAEILFYVFSVFNLTGLIAVYLLLPETEGRSLQQVQSFFTSL